jgi:sugar lactone lactonase YvrE
MTTTARICLLLALASSLSPPLAASPERRVWATAHIIPKWTTNQGSGYFSIVEGRNANLYIGTARYGISAYLVEFEPRTRRMAVVVDAQKEIGTAATGFAAQSKIHTRNNTGPSGKIYFGTKQGYPEGDEKRSDYPGGMPMVFDPASRRTRVYPIPVPQQGIISVTPDEARGVAYISTCSDERPIERTHFLVLDLESGSYRELTDCRHMYAFIVVDHRGRAYHPVLGGDIARYDPESGRLERLKQTIDGEPPPAGSLLVHPESHPINWDVSPDQKTLFAVAMSENQLYAYDLGAGGEVLPGRRLGKLLEGALETDCRAMCAGPRGDVWAAVTGKFPDRGTLLHLVSWRPGDAAPRDHGMLAIRNPRYTEFTGAAGKPLPWHHGMRTLPDGTLTPLYPMGICAARDGTVYVTVIVPYTLLEVKLQ